jgi:uncharacterized protein with von Willebrand factor type A (vWA) domain
MADDAGVLERVLEELSRRQETLGGNLVQFGALLNAAELGVTTTQLIGAAQALHVIDPARRDDFRAALAASLLTKQDNRPTFDLLFDRFWRLPRDEEPPDPPEPETLSGGETRLGAAQAVDVAYVRNESRGGMPEGDTPPETYSADDALLTKDFATYRDDELRAARRHLRQLAAKLATAASRRRRARSTGDEIDLRRTLRLAARRGGEAYAIAYRRRRVRRTKLVVLCDVSGSMDVYSRFLAQFLYGLRRELRGVSIFVFSTRLFELTPMLRARSYDNALARIARQVDGWSGGTRIGECIGVFNRRYAPATLGPRSIVAIISDGWERGDVELLGREMAALRRRAHRVLWLNPLLGSSGYQPVAQGMRAALPYVDQFLPVHNLASLERLARELTRLGRG